MLCLLETLFTKICHEPEFYSVGAGVVGVLKRLAENLDILVAPRRIDGLNGDFVNHDFLLLQAAKT